MKKRNKLLSKNIEKESIEVMLLSQESLNKDWSNKYDERWNKY